MTPAFVGPYRILERLGAGGMGEVYLAEDPRLKRNVALKRLSASPRSGPESRELLLKEARAAAHLSHPNIAVVYDVIEHDEQPFIVMEYVVGETLSSRLKRGPMSPLEVLDIAGQLTSALGEAHRRGIVHRDLKPANVILTHSGRVKILDFGLAKTLISDGAPDTTAGHVMGTPAYMSPEQMLGYRIDHRTDIYSLGLVLFELLTGQKPFDRRERPRLEMETERRVPRARDLAASVPEEMSDAVAHAMSWEPEKRPQSADHLAAELGIGASSAADGPTLSKTGERAPARPRNTRSTVFVVAALFLVTLSIAWLAWNRYRNLEPARPPVVAVLPLENVSGDPSLDYLGVGIAHTLITKLSAIPSITMVSRTATLEFGGGSRDAREVAVDLGASFVVRGSVQRVGDRILITANLVRADDSVAWGGELEGALDTLFDLQRRLAESLAEALHVNLTPEERRRLEVPPTKNVDAYADFSQGRYFLEREQAADEERGIQLLERAVDADPEFALAHAALSEAYWRHYERTKEREWTAKARRSAERARQLDPDHPSVHYALAVIERGTGESQAAVTELRRALALQPNYDDAHRLTGEILAEQGDVGGAARELERAIAIRPDFWGHYRALGLVHYNAGRFAEALSAFQRVTELQPDLATGFQSLGAVHHTVGDLDAAVGYYRRSIELSPNAPSFNNLGTVYYRQEKFAEAAEAYEEARRLEPNRPLTHRNLGDAYRRLGKDELANASYRRAAELHRSVLDVNPRDGETLGALAVIEAKLGRLDEALRLSEQAVALAPSSADVAYDRAVVSALGGRLSEATATLRRAVELGYAVNELRVDDDLAVLRALPEFQSMVGRDR